MEECVVKPQYNKLVSAICRYADSMMSCGESAYVYGMLTGTCGLSDAELIGMGLEWLVDLEGEE